LKNQWGFTGFCSRHSNVTELAARLTLLSYNLWSLFVQFFSGNKHQEAKTSRKDYLLIASQVVETGRETIIKTALNDNAWRRIVQGYDRLLAWLSATAPQLKAKNHWARALANSFELKNQVYGSFNCAF